MTSDYKDGGAKMLDVIAFINPLKVLRIAKYIDGHNQSKMEKLFNCYLKGLVTKNIELFFMGFVT